MSGWVGHRRQPRGVAVDRQALPRVGEVPPVEGVAHGQARDDRGGQLARVGLPLLVGVVADQRLVQRAPDEGHGLVLEVVRAARRHCRLSPDEVGGLTGGEGAVVEGAQGGQVDRHRVDATRVGREDVVAVVGEGREPVGVGPDLGVRGVEQVRAVLVHLDAGPLLAVGVRIASDMRTPLEDEHVRARGRGGPLGDGQAEEAGPDDDQPGRPHRLAQPCRHVCRIVTHRSAIRAGTKRLSILQW